MVNLKNDLEDRRGAAFGALGRSTWKLRWVLIGLVFLLAWRLIVSLPPRWFQGFSPWLIFVCLMAMPQAVLLMTPWLARNPGGGRLRIPGLRRCLIELGVAVLAAAAIVLGITALSVVADTAWPGAGMDQSFKSELATSWPPMMTYATLILAVFVAPFAEEVFFRGFLYNALRQRIQWVWAAGLSSLVFGLCHFEGTGYAVYATLIGVVLTLLYRWRRTLLTPILTHACVNLLFALSVLGTMAIQADQPRLGVMGSLDAEVCVIEFVAPDSAAKKAGIEAGDQIRFFNEKPISNFAQLREAIQGYAPGDRIPVVVKRDGPPFVVQAVIQRRGWPQ